MVARISPEKVEIHLEADISINTDPAQALEAPGGLFPMRARAFEMSEYRLMAGWPISIPKYDIHAKSMISGTGSSFAERVSPLNLITEASSRWVAHGDTYDTTALRWKVSQGREAEWGFSTNTAPTLIEDYTYRIGSEVFTHKALNFDQDDRNHMWADLSPLIGNSSGYTVIMVLSPNSVYGNTDDADYNGLWCPGYPSPGGTTFVDPDIDYFNSITMQGHYLYLETEAKERTRGISMAPALKTNAPMYLAIVFDRPEITFYAGESVDVIRTKTLPAGSTDAVPLDGHITLGRTPGTVLQTADMALFDLSLYTERLTSNRIAVELSKLAQAYGGGEQ